MTTLQQLEWTRREREQIEEISLEPAEKQSLLEELLKKEVKLLQTIDKLKLKAKEENKTAKIDRMLNTVS